MRIDVEQFGGIAPRINSTMLPLNAAQVAENCRLDRGDITPLSGLSTIIGTLPKTGTIQSLFRYQNPADETLYWLHWTGVVDAVLGTNTGDTTQRLYFCDGTKPKWTNFTLATGGGSNYPVTQYDLGVPIPSAAPTTAITTPGADQTLSKVARIYVYTWVTSYGEEGAPSPASTKLNVVSGDVVTVSGIASAPAGNYSMQYKRIYRSEVGADGSIAFYYVGQIAAASTSFVDNVADVNEALATTDYAPPPDTIQGFVSMPNGVIAGFTGNDIYFCEPYVPYAFPTKYSLTTEFPIVGLASFGQSLLVATKGTAYLVTGVDPASMSMEALQGTRGCVSKASIVSTGDGAIYASADGLVAVSGAGTKLITEEEFTQANWLAINPDTLIGRWHEGRYVGFTSSTGIIIDRSGKITTIAGITPSAMYVDPLSNKLYLVTAGRTLSRFDSGSTLTARWKSKKITIGANKSMPACARVEADTYPVTFKIWADGSLKATITVSSDASFWLPSALVNTSIEFEISGTAKFTHVTLGSSPKEVSRVR